MNKPQRMLIVSLLGLISLMFHTYFCEWDWGLDVPMYALDSKKIPNQAYEYLHTQQKQAQTYSDIYLVKERIAKYPANKNGTRVYYGIDGALGLGEGMFGSGRRTAFLLGIIFPIILITLAIFIWIGQKNKNDVLSRLASLRESLQANTTENKIEPTRAESKSRQSPSGLSFDDAITVSSIFDEYEWILTHHPDYKLQSQALVTHDGCRFDVMTIKNKSDNSLKIHFDLSKMQMI